MKCCLSLVSLSHVQLAELVVTLQEKDVAVRVVEQKAGEATVYLDGKVEFHFFFFFSLSLHSSQSHSMTYDWQISAPLFRGTLDKSTFVIQPISGSSLRYSFQHVGTKVSFFIFIFPAFFFLFTSSVVVRRDGADQEAAPALGSYAPGGVARFFRNAPLQHARQGASLIPCSWESFSLLSCLSLPFECRLSRLLLSLEIQCSQVRSCASLRR